MPTNGCAKPFVGINLLKNRIYASQIFLIRKWQVEHVRLMNTFRCKISQSVFVYVAQNSCEGVRRSAISSSLCSRVMSWRLKKVINQK